MSSNFNTQSTSYRLGFGRSQEERNAASVAREKMSFSNTAGNFFKAQTWEDAQSLNSPVAMAIRQIQRDSFEPDARWNLTRERLDQLVQDVDPAYWDMFADSVSEDHANMIRSQALQMTESRRRLAEAGWGGILANVGASIVDPTAIAAGMVTGGLSYGAIGTETTLQAARAARVSRYIRAGLINGVPQAVIDAYSASQSPDFGAADVASGFLGSVGFGAFMGRQGLRDATALAAGKAVDSRKMVALGGALSQALPSTLIDATFNDKAATELLGMTAFNMVLGAGFSTMARQSEMGRAMEDWGRATMKDVDQRALYEEGLNPGYKAPQASVQTQAMLAGFEDDEVSFAKNVADAEGMKKRGGVVVDPTKPVAAESAASLVPPAQQQTVQSLPDITETLNSPDWVKQNVRNGRKLADSIGVTATIDDLASKRLTAQQIAIELKKSGKFDNMSLGDIKSEVVVPARTSMGIPSLKPKAEFEAWLNARNARLAQALPVSQAAAASPVPPSIPIREIVNYADWAKKMRELRLPSSKDDFRSWLGIITENRKTPVPYIDANGEQRIANSAFDITDDDVLQGEFSIPELKKSVSSPVPPSVPVKGGLPTVAPNIMPAIVESVMTEQLTTGGNRRFVKDPIVPIGKAKINPNWERGMLDLSNVTDSKLAMEGARMFGPHQQISGGGTSVERFIANQIAFDPIGKVDPESRNIGAATWADARSRGESALLESQIEALRVKYNENAAKAGYAEATEDQFSEMLGDALLVGQDNPRAIDDAIAGRVMHGNRFDSTPQNRPIIASAEVAQAAKLQFAHNKRIAEIMKKMGVEGVDVDDHWTHIAWDNGLMRRYWTEQPGGEVKIRLAFANSVERMMERGDLESLFPGLEASEKLQARATTAKMIADQIIMNGGTHNELDAAVQHSIITVDQWNQLEEKIKAKIPNASIKAIRELMFELKPMEGEDKAASFLKRRIPMDYTFRTRFDDGTTLSPADFINKDATTGNRHYTRRAFGVAALAEMGRVLKEAYDLPAQPRTIQDFIAIAQRSKSLENNADPASLYNLQHLLNQVAGMPLEYSVFGRGENVSAYQSSLRLFRSSIRFALLGGPNAMIGQAQEFAGITGVHGVGVLQKALPWAMDLRKKLVEGGKIDSALMKMAVEYGFVSGQMTDRVMSSHINEDGQLASKGASLKQRLAHVADRWSAKLNRASGVGSGESFTRNIQEGASFYAAADFLYKTAKGEHAPTVGDLELQQWGTTRKEFDRVLEQIRKNAVMTDAGYHEVNLDKWKNADGDPDIEAMAAYERIVVKDARLAVQMGESTLIPRSWFSTEGKIATQLMPYAYSSYFTRLLPAIRRKGDLRSANAMFQAMVASAISVLALTYMQSIGREDRQEFLEKRLEPGKFARNVIARSSFATLVPRFVDAFAAGAGYKAPFSGSRLSGLGQDGGFFGAIAGNPSIDRLQKIVGAGRGLIRAPLDSDYDFSRRDMRNTLGALGFPDYLGVHNVVMQLSDLPERPN